MTGVKYAAYMGLLTLGIIAVLLVLGVLVAIAVLYHVYWGLACVPAGILIGVAVTWFMDRRNGR